MINLFIVDDNPRDRRGVAGLCEWETYGCRLAGTFENGQEALEAAESTRPDLVLSDVQMPVMDGLAFGKKLKERYPDVKMVYMSNYDSFDFARSALQLDAEDYVLKPIRKADFLETIASVTKKIAQERAMGRERKELLEHIRQSLPLHQDQFVRELLFGVYGEEDAESLRTRSELLELRFPEGGQYRVILLHMEEAEPHPSAIPGYLRFMHYLNRQRTQELPAPGSVFRMTPASDRRLAIIAGADPEQDRAELDVLDWIMQAEEELEATAPMRISVGISKRGSLKELSALYAQSVRALEAKMYSDRNPKILFYEEVDGEMEPADKAEAAQQLQHELHELLYSAHPPDLGPWLDKYLGGQGAQIRASEVKGFMIVLMGTLQQLYVEAGKPAQAWLERGLQLWAKLEQATGLSDLHSELAKLIALGRSELLDDQTSYYDKVVKSVKTIIAQRYKEAVTIQEIADEVFLSLSHANNIFKSKTGQTIFDYLTEYRVEQSKLLLRQPDSKIYDVAEEVGYTSKSHFCLIFKKYTGITPSAYKNQWG